MVVLPGRRILLKALVTCLSVLFGLMLLVYLRNGSCRMGLMLKVLQSVWLLSVMSGLMGAWLRIRSLVLHRQVRGVLLVILVIFGPIVGGAILIDDISCDRAIGSCRGYCSVPGPLQTVQRAEFWGSSLLFRLLMAFTLVSII